MAQTPSEKKADSARDAALRDSYVKAEKKLRENHGEEFNRIRAQILKDDHGITWAPKPTAEEKAAEQLAAILNEFPDLVDKVTPRVDQQGGAS